MAHVIEQNSTILAAQADILIKRGDTVSPAFTLTDPNNSGADFDLSVYTTIRMQVKSYVNGNISLFELTLAGATLTVTGAGNNVLTMILIPAQTNTKAGVYFYDVEGTKASGEVETVLEGDFTIDADVSRTP